MSVGIVSEQVILIFPRGIVVRAMGREKKEQTRDDSTKGRHKQTGDEIYSY